MPRRILIIEDNRDLAELVSLHLQDLGCEVSLAADGTTGFEQALAREFDLIILDLMLPGTPGLEICKQLRAQKRYIPILMLTAKTAEVDRVVGLEIGADDYITKPFSMPELMARVKAVFRRIEEMSKPGQEPSRTISAGDLHIDIGKHTVSIAGEAVELTAKEFALLAHFAKNPGQVYTRAQLLDLVWGYSHAG
ncbi:MAG: response regulator transcription factor, partial [Burkholderiales bacterium]